VDEALKKFAEDTDNHKIINDGKVIRYGTIASPDPLLEDFLIDNIVAKKSKTLSLDLERLIDKKKKVELKQERYSDILGRAEYADLLEKREELEKRYNGNQERIQRALARERFVMPPECDFEFLYSKREEANIGDLINIALDKIEDENKGKLENVFRAIDFNSEPILGETIERNRRLKNLLEDFADERVDFRPSHLGGNDVIGDVYEYLIDKFASGAGKKGGEFYTPKSVSVLLAKLLDPTGKIVTPWTLRNWRLQGGMPSFSVGKRIFFRLSSVSK
jgi:hypothetical protein